jgi:acyl-CoA reductase-like NAD-dependent aldehyde dehydrogenase
MATSTFADPSGRPFPAASRMLLAALLFGLAVVPSHAQQQPRVTGMYIDMVYIPQAGDVLGTEVFLVFTGSATRDALVGSLETERVSLRRGNSYWQ